MNDDLMLTGESGSKRELTHAWERSSYGRRTFRATRELA